MDSGASYHYVTKNDYLTNYTTELGQEHPRSVVVGNDQALPIAGVGTLELECKVSGNTHDVTLHRVYHVPDLCTNLLSLSRLTAAGGKVSMQNSKMLVSKQGKECMFAEKSKPNSHKHAGLYLLKNAHIKCTNVASAFAITQKQVDPSIWHARMGHLGLSTMKKLPEIVNGCTFEPNSINDLRNRTCETCAVTRTTRAPQSAADRTNKVASA